MYAADHIVDIGPGAGIHGGNSCPGTIEEIKITQIPSLATCQELKIEIQRKAKAKWKMVRNHWC